MDKEALKQKYLHGQLSDAEHISFLELLEKDKIFADELEIETAFYAKRNLDLKTELGLNTRPSTKNKVSSNLGRNLILLSLLLLITVFFARKFIYNNDATQIEDHYLVHLEQPFEAPAVLLGQSEKSENDWNMALQAYKNDQFSKSANIISQLQSRTDEQELYLGLSFLFTEDNDLLNRSAQSFSKVINSSETKYRDVALWYASLTALKLNDNQQAIKYLEEIVSEEYWNHQKASVMLNSLAQ